MRGVPTPMPAVGSRFGRLRVRSSRVRQNAHGDRLALCSCDCGRMIFVRLVNLRKGVSRSCGCLRREMVLARNHVHGFAVDQNPLYHVWRQMIRRCRDQAHSNYQFYGARGIDVCPAWADDYSVFETWALGAGYREGLTLERMDNDAGYAPDNCCWATRKEQARNRRNTRLLAAFGEQKCMAAWVEDPRCAVGLKTFQARIARGWSVERALTEEVLAHAG